MPDVRLLHPIEDVALFAIRRVVGHTCSIVLPIVSKNPNLKHEELLAS